MYIIALQLRTSLMSMVCNKALNLSNTDRQKYTTGEITNLMSVDAQRIITAFPLTGQIWAAPLSIILAMYFLFAEVKYAMFAGVGVLIVILPINVGLLHIKIWSTYLFTFAFIIDALQ